MCKKKDVVPRLTNDFWRWRLKDGDESDYYYCDYYGAGAVDYWCYLQQVQMSVSGRAWENGLGELVAFGVLG